MTKIEIIGNHSIEQDVMDALKEHNCGQYFTKIPSIQGVGKSGPRMGDHIWPESNFMMIIYCETSEAELIETCITEVKKQFPTEGLKLFRTEHQ